MSEKSPSSTSSDAHLHELVEEVRRELHVAHFEITRRVGAAVGAGAEAELEDSVLRERVLVRELGLVVGQVDAVHAPLRRRSNLEGRFYFC